MRTVAGVAPFIWASFVIATSSDPSFSATMKVESEHRFVTVHFEGDIVPGDAERLARLALSLKPENVWELNWLHVWISSEGGSVDEALKIGRFLRTYNASVLVSRQNDCFSSCVFILMAGVIRSYGRIGVHRPFLFAAGRKDHIERAFHETRNKLEKYFDEMRVAKSLLDLMYSVPPEEMRVLSEDEKQMYLPAMDPVYDEQRVADSAQTYGITSFEYRMRRNNAHTECDHYLINASKPEDLISWENCHNAVSWGLSMEDYLLRKALVRKACNDEVLDRADLGVPAGLSRRDCHMYVMQHGVRRSSDCWWCDDPIVRHGSTKGGSVR